MRGLALALLPAAALAHPVDEVVQGAYLTLAPGEVRLDLAVAPGSEVAAVLVAALDPDGDGAVADGEARAWAEGVLARSALTLDGRAAAWALGGVVVPPLDALAAGLAEVRVQATAPRPEAAGPRELGFEAGYEPAPSLWMANVFLAPGEGWAYQVTAQERDGDGRGLRVAYEAAGP